MRKISFQYYKSNMLISVMSILTIAIYALNEWLNSNLGYTIGVTTVIWLLLLWIDYHLWHFTPFKYLLWAPNISGIYKGSIVYLNDKNEKSTMNCEMLVRQTASQVSFSGKFYNNAGEVSTRSKSTSSTIEKGEDGTFRVIFSYLNEGSNTQSLEKHAGTCTMEIEISHGKVKEMHGEYFTSRKTVGSISLTPKP